MATAELSTGRRRRIHDVLSGYVERGEIPGLVALTWHGGATHVDVLGSLSVGGRPVARDSIFRIASMTKPVIAVATMMLVEECVLRLDDPVDDLLPELAGRRVLVDPVGPIDDTVPAVRAITVRDLLTFRMGLGQIMAPPGTYPLQAAFAAARVGDGPPQPAMMPPPDEWLRGLATLPLQYQPGTRWLYNTPSDVLGVLLARAAGQPLETFLRERIFGPLGMADTGFSVPPMKLDRFATCYRRDPDGDGLLVFDAAEDGQWADPPPFASGGGGLVSTVDDYLAFGRMLLAGGWSGSQRLLSDASVELMTSDQLTPAQKAVSGLYPGHFDDRGWGFGVQVVTRRDDIAATPGQFGWDGGLGTSWTSDPGAKLVTILLTQRAWDSPVRPRWLRDFRTSVYQALD